MAASGSDWRPFHLLYPDIQGIVNLRRPPTDGEIRLGITADELKGRRKKKTEPTADEERQCWICSRRVTQVFADGPEAGHRGSYRDIPCPLSMRAESHQLDPLPLPNEPGAPAWAWFDLPISKNWMTPTEPGTWTHRTNARKAERYRQRQDDSHDRAVPADD